MTVTWTPGGAYEDIRYELSGDGIAKITIDRPEVRNAFRPQTVVEISRGMEPARAHAGSPGGRAGARGPRGRRDRARGRGAARLLLGRRPARARRHGLPDRPRP